MDKTRPPTSFGVFKPVGHIVMAFRNDDDLHTAEDALTHHGFSRLDMVSYTPQEMLTQTERDMQQASPLASIGQDMNLIKAHRAFAQAGCSFLVVRAADDQHVRDATAVAQQAHAAAAQRYGRLIVEELISSPRHGNQVFESSDRGLDLQVPKPLAH